MDARCFDVALKIVLAQALSSNGLEQASLDGLELLLDGFALLARAKVVYKGLGKIPLEDLKVVVETFPFSEEVVNNLETARSKCSQTLEQEMRTKLAEKYKQYLHLHSAESKWLPEQLHYSSLESYTNFKEYRGIFQSEMKEVVQRAIQEHAGPATINFLLSQPLIQDASEPAEVKKMYLATLPNDTCAGHSPEGAGGASQRPDSECEACKGKRGDHTCKGTTLFSSLVRNVKVCLL
jgi:hypothetical protein